MSESIRAAERLTAVIAALGGKSVLKQDSACAAYARSLEEPGTAPQVRAEDLMAFRRNVLASYKEMGIAGLDNRMWRELPGVLWFGNAEERVSKLVPALWPAYLDHTSRFPHRLTTAVEAWLLDFDSADASIIQAGVDLAARLAKADYPRLEFWRRAHTQFEMFNARSGPERFARAILDSNRPLDDTLRVGGMDDVLRSQGGYFHDVARHIFERVPVVFRNAQADLIWSRVQPLVSAERQVRNAHGKPIHHLDLRWNDLDDVVGTKCLAAWAIENAHSSAPRQSVMQFLLATLGDPRLRPQRWQRVDPKCRDLMCRWLSEKHLEAFLRLISSGNDTAQWQYRAAFWRACFRKIPDAQVWVVLGPDLAGRAGLVREFEGNFGRMGASGQGVLLMRLGSLVLSEWSHIGALRAWDYGDHRCPNLYLPPEQPYSTGTEDRGLRADSLQFPELQGFRRAGPTYGPRGLSHFSPQEGQWQKRAAYLIREKIGVLLTSADYMPK